MGFLNKQAMHIVSFAQGFILKSCQKWLRAGMFLRLMLRNR